jgi:hypothetical protein
VGFKRLRWALLNTKSEFLTEALYMTKAWYDNIVCGKWNKHDGAIVQRYELQAIAKSIVSLVSWHFIWIWIFKQWFK